ncbi:MAG TPA: conjugal transfer protein TraF [Nitrospiraceae bacterium]|nr:conjugal transfer protein TraF [Nitrospiraceae bacterium]
MIRVFVVLRFFGFALCVVGFICPLTAEAVEFVIVGPRATGMGGAGVAVTTDALATYWNPAGLAMVRSLDIRGQASAYGIDRLGMAEAVRNINNTNLNDTSPANQAKVQGFVNQLNQPGGSVSVSGAAGLYFKGFYGNHAFGMNVSDVATGGSFLSIPISVTSTGNNLNINGQLALRALEARQVAFSYAYAFADRTFSIGATAKIIQGAAYIGQIGVVGADDNSNIQDALGKAKLSTAVGIDVGAVYRPASWIRFGIVGKDLNQPTFDTPIGGEFKLTPQVRAGVAVNPTSSLTLTFDGDVTSNKTLVPGVKSRILSLGMEQNILSDFLSLRAGVLKNVEDATSTFVPTAGFGIRIFALRVDVGGGYDFRERQALASASVAMTF